MPETFRTVFDVRDLLPDVVIGWVALAVLVFLIGALLLPDARPVILRRWWLSAAVAVVLLVGEAVRHPSDWWIVGIGLLLIILGTLSERHGAGLRLRSSHDVMFAPPGSAAVAGAGFLLFFAGILGAAESGAIGLSQQLAAGQTTALVGPVQDYVAGPDGKQDCFTVSDRQFCFSDYEVTPGFSNTQSFGSPVRNGELVRINAVGDTIVRLEIAQP